MATKSRNVGKNIRKPAVPEKPAGETTEQLVQRIKRDMLWVVASALVAMALGLAAGQLIKF
jgi:hypothetical protein